MTTGADQVAGRARDRYRELLGREPDGVWVAPGRVNLIGEHTDYNEGFVLPFAIEAVTAAAVGRRDDDVVRGWSAQCGAADTVVPATGSLSVSGWIGYAAGVVWALRQQGLSVAGCDLVVDSEVPVGAGLSSSAALECAVGLALTDLSGVRTDRMAIARAGQRAEHEAVGAPVGVMDQTVSLLGRAGNALFLDCRTLAADQLPLRLAQDGLQLLVIDTKVSHSNAADGYARRRRECSQAAARLGVAALRDLPRQRLSELDGDLLRRARHVVTENDRVLAAVELLRQGRLRELGPLLNASHASLRDDFEVSVAELDLAADVAVDAGALGARMTGGGFGGSALALVPAPAAGDVTQAVLTGFGRAGWAAPDVFQVRPAAGARRVEVV